jgi:hypothetical protein
MAATRNYLYNTRSPESADGLAGMHDGLKRSAIMINAWQKGWSDSNKISIFLHAGKGI